MEEIFNILNSYHKFQQLLWLKNTNFQSLITYIKYISINLNLQESNTKLKLLRILIINISRLDSSTHRKLFDIIVGFNSRI